MTTAMISWDTLSVNVFSNNINFLLKDTAVFCENWTMEKLTFELKQFLTIILETEDFLAKPNKVKEKDPKLIKVQREWDASVAPNFCFAF